MIQKLVSASDGPVEAEPCKVVEGVMVPLIRVWVWVWVWVRARARARVRARVRATVRSHGTFSRG